MVYHISKNMINIRINSLYFSLRMMRLDVDNYPIIKLRSSNQSTLLSTLNDELNQLPPDIYSVERVSLSRTRKNTDNDEEYLNKYGLVLRCKLLEKSNPIIPSLRLHITTSYPEQPPEILSLTKTMPPKLEFTGFHFIFSVGLFLNLYMTYSRWTSIF